jgi:hypothetical protein
LLVESHGDYSEVSGSLFKVVLVSASFTLNGDNLILDIVGISLVTISNCLKCILAFLLVVDNSFLKLLHALV